MCGAGLILWEAGTPGRQQLARFTALSKDISPSAQPIISETSSEPEQAAQSPQLKWKPSSENDVETVPEITSSRYKKCLSSIPDLALYQVEFSLAFKTKGNRYYKLFDKGDGAFSAPI